MEELIGRSLLETSAGLAALSALFGVAALISWWFSRRRSRLWDRRQPIDAAELLAEALEMQPAPGATTPAEPEAESPGSEALDHDDGDDDLPVPKLGVGDLLQPPSELPEIQDLLVPARDVLGSLTVADELTLTLDDAAEIVAPATKLDPGTPASEAPAVPLASAGASDDPRVSRGAGRLALRSGRAAAAVPLLEAALDHDPDDVEARLDVCSAHAALHRFDGVLRHARRGLERTPDDGRLLLHLSDAAMELGAPDEALELAAQALRALPEPRCFFHLTRQLAITRRLREGDSERLRHALEKYPGESALLYAAGVFEAMYGRSEAALRILRAAHVREPLPRYQRAIEHEIHALTDPGEDRAAAA